VIEGRVEVPQFGVAERRVRDERLRLAIHGRKPSPPELESRVADEQQANGSSLQASLFGTILWCLTLGIVLLRRSFGSTAEPAADRATAGA
jgi:hypothetical protein